MKQNSDTLRNKAETMYLLQCDEDIELDLL